MEYFLGYLFISLATLVVAFIYHEIDVDRRKDRLAIIGLCVFWPLTVIAILVLMVMYVYVRALYNRIKKIYEKYGADKGPKYSFESYEGHRVDIEHLINQLSINEMRIFKHADWLGAWNLHDKSKELLEARMKQMVEQRDFEKYFLEK